MSAGRRKELGGSGASQCLERPLATTRAPRLSPAADFLGKQETHFEHMVELRGIPYQSSLQQPSTGYSRLLTPILEQLVRTPCPLLKAMSHWERPPDAVPALRQGCPFSAPQECSSQGWREASPPPWEGAQDWSDLPWLAGLFPGEG